MNRRATLPSPGLLLIKCMLACLLALGVAFFGAQVTRAQTFERWVSSQIGNDANNCTRSVINPDDENELEEDAYETRACATIARAIAVANPGDIIIVAQGTYVQPLTIYKRLTIRGGFPLILYEDDGDSVLDFERSPSPTPNPTLYPTIIQAAHPALRIETRSGIPASFSPDPMAVKLEGLRVQIGGIQIYSAEGINGDGIFTFAGYGDIELSQVQIQSVVSGGNGGGLFVNGLVPGGLNRTSVTMQDGYISGSSGANGGGLYATGTTDVTLENVLIQNNTASSNGGGVHVTSGAKATLLDATLYNNTASSGNGGGVYVSGGELSYTSGILDDNQANSGRGGGLYATGSLTVTIGGLTVTHNSASLGGGLAFASIDPQLGDLYLGENEATSAGGALHATGSGFTLAGSALMTNTVSGGNGGALFLDVLNDKTITLTGNTIQGNKATSGQGGGLFGTGSGVVTLSGNDFALNQAQHGGGAAIQSARATLSGNSFAANMLVGSGNGGGLYLSGLASGSTLNGDSFTLNNGGNGGGLYIQNSSGLTLSGLNLAENEANQGGGFYITGGAVALGGDPNVGKNTATTAGGGGYLTGGVALSGLNLNLAENIAPEGGGLVVNGATMALSVAMTLLDNAATSGDGGGLYAVNSAGITIQDLFAQANRAHQRGGAIYADGAPIQFGTATVQSNETTTGAGGAFYLATGAYGASGHVAFSDNKAATDGGAFATDDATLTFGGDLELADNSALNGKGGALYLVAPMGQTRQASFDAFELRNNLAAIGGAIYAERVQLNFAPNTVFRENSAQSTTDGHGGAIYVLGAPLTLDDVLFEQNRAFVHGGAVYIQDGSLTVNADASFQDNFTFAGDGGAVYAAGAGQVTVNGAHFADNRAAAGGGALAVAGGNLTVGAGSQFTGNAAEGGPGGAIRIQGSAATLTQAELAENEAGSGSGSGGDGDGGGVYAVVDTLTVAGTTLRANVSEGAGGGLFVQAGNADVQGSTFEENRAHNGGGAYLLGPGQAQWADNTVAQNHAQHQGGGLYLLGMTLGLDRSNLSQNAAQENGGGVYLLYGGVAMTNTVVAQNIVTATTGIGGAIYARNAALSALHSTLADHAHPALLSSAAAIFVDAPAAGAGEGGFSTPAAGSVTVQNSIVGNNQIGLYLLPGNSATLMHNLWQNSRFNWTGYGTFDPVSGNRRGDPRFINAGQGDYRIRRDSPAFDLAAPSSVAADKIGVSRTQGFAPDAGAFEHRYTQGLYIDAQVEPPFARTGDTVVYTIRLRNTSAQTVAGVEFQATLPNQQPAPTSNQANCQGPFCTASLGTIDPGQETVLSISAQVQGQAPASGLGNMNANISVGADAFGAPDAYGISDLSATARSYLHTCRVAFNGNTYPSVQAAVDAAPGDGSGIIQVGGYCGEIHTTGGIRQAVTLNKNVTLQGGWNSDFSLHDPEQFSSAIDAGGLGRVLGITGGATPLIEDIALRGGSAQGLGGGQWGKDAGGGLLIVGAGATLRGVTIANNLSADLGGGVYIESAQPVRFERSGLLQNEAGERGGGIYLYQSDPDLVDITLTGNRARAGGGLYLFQSAPEIRAEQAGSPSNPACRIDGNQATNSVLLLDGESPTFWLGPGGGGAIFFEESPAALVRCSVRNNQARTGAGLYVHRSAVTLQQNIVTGNTTSAAQLSSDGDGGGLYVAGGDPAALTLESNFFGFNEALRGSALFAGLQSSATATLRHSTIAHNLGQSAVYARGQTNLSLLDSIVAFNSGTAIFAADAPGGAAAIVSLNRTLWHENQSNTGTSTGLAVVQTQNDHTGDPAFFDDGFRIKRVSAAYGRGGMGALLADRDGDARPQGQNRDLGADEYAPAVVVRYVAVAGSGSAPCTNFLLPCPSLQAALDAANPGDLIKLAGGTYTGVQSRNDQTQMAYIDKEVSIQGGYFAQTDNNDVTDGLFTLYDWEQPHPVENPTVLDATFQGRVLTIVSPAGQTIAPALAYLTLTNGQSAGDGGGVLVDGAAPSFTNVAILENRALRGGGLFLRNSNGHFAQLTLSGNLATQSGGGIHLHSGAPTLQNLTLEANLAVSGAGIYVGDANGLLQASTIRNNGDANTVAGGGIHLFSGATRILTNTVTNNQAQAGGGLYLHSTQAQIEGNRVSENRALGQSGGSQKAQGGGIFVVGGAPQLRNNTVLSNRAATDQSGQNGQGGGFYLQATNAVLVDNDVASNVASAGGGLYLDAVEGATVEQNLVRDNRAEQGETAKGGGLYLHSGSVRLHELTVRNNRAKRGGGLYVGGGNGSTLSQNQIHDNLAQDHGGGLFIEQSSPIVTANQIRKNSTTQGSGAGVYLLQSDTQLLDNHVVENLAALNGGGFYLERDRSVVRGGVAENNRANSGGGFYFQNLLDPAVGQAAPPLVEHVEIIGNRAAANGGGIYARQSRARLRYLTIRNNVAVNDGGGVYLEESVLSEFEANLVAANQAGARGGGLAFVRRSHTLSASNVVIDNHADTDGGGVAILGAAPTLAHTTLARNVPNGVMMAVFNNEGGSAQLYNSIIVGHDQGVRAYAGVQVRLDGTLFHANQADKSGPDGTIVSSNEVTGDPAFVGDEYHIGAASAAVGAGIPLSLPIGGDIDGEARVQGSGPDLGADELTAPCQVVRAGSLSTVYNSVQAAIDASNNNDELRLSGTCTGLHTRNGKIQVAYVDKNLTLVGGFAPGNWDAPAGAGYPTVLDVRSTTGNENDPDEAGRAMYVAPNVLVVLENMTLLNGDAVGQGGGPEDADAGGNLLVDGVSTLTIRNVTFQKGQAVYGGGLYLRTNAGLVTGSTFLGNRATQSGGGFYVLGGNTDLGLRNNTLIRNEARTGAGGTVAGGTVAGGQASIANNWFEENQATGSTGRGGGLFADQSEAALINNHFYSNRATEGGAIYVANGQPAVYNNMAGGNVAQQGSAFYLLNAPVHLRHNTVVDNPGPTGTAAIYLTAQSGTLTVEFTNNILVGHTLALRAGDNAGITVRANLWHENQTHWQGDVVQGQANLFESPLLRNRAERDYFLRDDSPAIDRGVNAGVNIDIQNRQRPGRLGYDIGADEFLVASVNASLGAVPNPVASGEKLAYILNVNNNGDVDLVVNMALALPAGVTPDGPTQFSEVALPRGENWSETVVVTVDATFTGAIATTLTVSSAQGASATATTTAIATDITSEILTLALDALPSPVPAGSQVRLQLRVTNQGGVPLNTSIQATLPPAMTLSGPQSGALSWTPRISGPDGVWTTVLTATVAANAPDSLPIGVNITSAEGPSLQRTVNIPLAKPALVAGITVEPGQAVSGAALVYRFTLTNTGNMPLTGLVTPTLPSRVVAENLAENASWSLNLQPGASDTRSVPVVVETGYIGPLSSTLAAATDQGVSAAAQLTTPARRSTLAFSKTALGGEWHNADSWQPRGVPDSADVVLIPEESTMTASAPIDIRALRNHGELILQGASAAGVQTQQLRVAQVLENFGEIRGEDGIASGAPGVSLDIQMDIQVGSLYNEGAIRGGNGAPSGGSGGTLRLSAGSLTNNGSILGGEGADVTSANAGIGGGRGGAIFVAVEPGQLVNQGLIAAGSGGAAHPAAEPPQAGGRGGDITLLGTSLIRLDDSEVRAGAGGAGTRTNLDGAIGEIVAAAVQVSAVETRFTRGQVTLVQSGDTGVNFAVLAPALVAGRVGGSEVVIPLRIYNRSARQETYNITLISGPSGWQPQGLPASITVPAFKSQATAVRLRPPGVAGAAEIGGPAEIVEMAALGLSLELRVTSQRSAAQRVPVPIGIVDGFAFGRVVLHVPQALAGSTVGAAQAAAPEDPARYDSAHDDPEVAEDEDTTHYADDLPIEEEADPALISPAEPDNRLYLPVIQEK